MDIIFAASQGGDKPTMEPGRGQAHAPTLYEKRLLRKPFVIG